ncbi:hypothetical protein N431DRAFT_557054 [Stipitochalara longipes BDJ]|nr:hypothetical protein N431DRAFT_557054 [Stipitochalara longipes BDJ]
MPPNQQPESDLNTPLLAEQLSSTLRTKGRKSNLVPTICNVLVAALTIFIVLVIIFCFLVFMWPKRQVRSEWPSDGNLGIGFHLTTAYATAALAYANGTTSAVVKIEVSGEYMNMISRLSLESSKHLHKPYHNVAESTSDYLRQFVRRAREVIGLPASPDVGRLSTVIKDLRTAVESRLGHEISAVTITIPTIVALYEEDLRDAFAYSGLQYVEIYAYDNHRRIHDTSAAYAGHGLKSSPPVTGVELSEPKSAQGDIDREFLLLVQYTRNCLITSQTEVKGLYAEEIPHYENFNLGYDLSHEKEDYWKSVEEAIQKPVKASYIPRRISKVLVHGESSQDPVFREVLEKAIRGITNDSLPIYRDDPVFVAAKGVAELGRMALAGRDEALGSDEL